MNHAEKAEKAEKVYNSGFENPQRARKKCGKSKSKSPDGPFSALIRNNMRTLKLYKISLFRKIGLFRKGL